MFNGKNKAVTFSFDDGVLQDKRMIKILDKYGLKCTFNLNSDLFGTPNVLRNNGVSAAHCKPAREEVRAIYEGHEIAGHTLTHPLLPSLDEEEIIRQVENDRLALSEIAGYEVVGFAYPCGGQNYDHRVSEIIKNKTGVKYARTIEDSSCFALWDNLFEFKPTSRTFKKLDYLFEMGEKFIDSQPSKPELFYIWGHSYEFDFDDSWEKFEDFCRFISGRSDIFYGTNKEVFLGK